MGDAPQVGQYFLVEPTQPMLRITEVYSQKATAFFVKAEDGFRYLIIQDQNEGMWVTLMKIERGNF